MSEEKKDVTEEADQTIVLDPDKLGESDKPTDSTGDVDTLMKAVSDLREMVATADQKASDDGRRSDDREKIDRVQADITGLQKSLNSVLNQRSDRKAEFEVSEDTNVASYSPVQLKALISNKAQAGSELEEIQRGNDELYLAQTLMGGRDLRQCEGIMDYARTNHPALFKAMETGGSATGAEWIPTNFSSSLFEDVRLNLRVANQHSRFNMPTDPYKFPVEGADATAYSVPENTTDDADLTAGNRVTASTPGTINRAFATSKVGVRVVVSTEMTEDSVIATLPYVREKIVLALANAQENTVINGDERTSGLTNIDGATLTTSHKIAYDGYRRAIQLAGTTSNAAGALSLAEVRAARTDLGKYGVDIGQLFWLVGINAYNNLLGFTEVTTVDTFGPRATIHAGQLGALDGIPIIVSEHVPEDLDAEGLNSGTGTQTEVMLVRRDQFRFGDSRAITLKSKERIETDQQVLVALQRLDFKSMLVPSATNTVASAVVNVALV